MLAVVLAPAVPAATDIILSIFLQRTKKQMFWQKKQHDIFSHTSVCAERHKTVNKHRMQSLFTDKLNKRR